jgi:hypothetical protein
MKMKLYYPETPLCGLMMEREIETISILKGGFDSIPWHV